MNPAIKLVIFLLTIFISNGIVFAGSDPVNWDGEAVKVLEQMDDYTDSMNSFVIKTESYNDASIGAGLVVSNASHSTVSVDRPHSLHSVTHTGTQMNEIYLHKGTLTVYTDEQKFFTRAKVPENLHESLVFMLEEFDVETPMFDLLVLNSLDHLVDREADVIYVNGNSSIRGVDCHHILISGPNSDLQIWVEKGDKPTPKRTLMTYRGNESLPRHEVFIDWVATDGFKKPLFEFTPPKGSQEIDFIDTP